MTFLALPGQYQMLSYVATPLISDADRCELAG